MGEVAKAHDRVHDVETRTQTRERQQGRVLNHGAAIDLGVMLQDAAAGDERGGMDFGPRTDKRRRYNASVAMNARTTPGSRNQQRMCQQPRAGAPRRAGRAAPSESILCPGSAPRDGYVAPCYREQVAGFAEELR